MKRLNRTAVFAFILLISPVSAGAEGTFAEKIPSLYAAQDFSGAKVQARVAGYDLSAHQTLSRAILLIRENYVEPERIKPYEMFLASLDYIQRLVPEVMVDDSLAPTRVTVSAGNRSQAFDLGGLDQLWEVTMALRDIFRFLQTHVTDPAKQRDIEYAAINGMLSTLDPHSVLLKPENFDEMKLSTKGEFGGLGIVISIRDGGLTIIAPIEDTPAGQAGLRAKDKIVKIGEESTINMGLDEAVQLLRGKPDSQVTIAVQRKGWTEAKQFVLKRAIIKIESVTSELLEEGIGYVKIKSFQGNTYGDLQTHLERLKKKNKDNDLRGLVLDLRNNPGGLLDQAILISDRFISRGPLVITVGESNRRREVKYAHQGPGEDDYPIAVLVNGGSASASEIVAGALKNHDRAVIVGQQSFGKGSVQVLYDFKDRSALKLTIAQYLTPGDISIQSVGIVPDVGVVPAVLEREAIHLFVDDEAPREKDLDHHLNQRGASALTTSAFKLYHLSDKERDELDPTQAFDEEVATGKFDYDFETHLAHDILATSKSHNRQAMLKGAQALLDARTRNEDGVIAKRMGELGVDWSRPAAAPSGVAKASVELHTNVGQANAMAGNVLVVSATVRNSGKTPIWRAFGTTTSDNPLLRGLEFAFGHIAPGQSRCWDVNIKLPSDMPARADIVKLQLGDVFAATQGQGGEARVQIQEPPKPRFAYTARIDDSRGNGDGVLQAGESADLLIAVTNIGPAVAQDVTVTLKNLAGIHLFLDTGREKIGRLGPRETKIAKLQFHVHGKEVLPVRQIEQNAQDDVVIVRQEAPQVGTTLGLRVGIWDASSGAQFADKLEIPVVGPHKVHLQDRIVRIKDTSGAQVYSGADRTADILGQLSHKTLLRSRHTAGDFVQIELPPSGTGYVRSNVIETYVLPKGKSVGAPLWHKTPATQGPTIEVDMASLVTDKDTLHIVGKVLSAKPLLDMFIFVGEKKVYFRALDAVLSSSGAYVFAFDVPVKLVNGLNTLAILARQNPDLVARHIVGLLRQPAAATSPKVGEKRATTKSRTLAPTPL